MSDALFSADFRAQPYWWDDVAPPEAPERTVPRHCDVVVVGAGYTGLSAALHTARGGRDSVVFDAEAAGFGCSSRNGGQVSTSIKPGLAELSRRHGGDHARRILGEGHRALAWLEEFIRREGIDCDFEVCGRFHAAHNRAQYEALARAVDREPAGLETGAWVVPRDEQHSEIGSDAYFGGIVHPRHGAVHPARLHAGLLRRAGEAGARVVTHCPVTAIRRDGSLFEVQTVRGNVRTRDVIVATNGYTGPFAPWHRRRVIPIGSYVIATEPIGPECMARLIPRNRVVSDSRRVVYYYRASPDRTRMLFGGRVSLDETDPRRSAPRLHADMVALFPELRSVRISHSWVGFVAYTFSTLADVGRRDGVYHAMGYCGSGVSMAAYLGMRVGQQVLGLDEGRTAFDDLPFRTRPLYGGKPWFLAPSLAYFRLRDRLPV